MKHFGGIMPAKIAKKLDEFSSVLDNKSLNNDNYETYYVDTLKGRGENPIDRFLYQIKSDMEKNWKVLFAGFKGCGKSTELLRLKRKLDKQFMITIFSVQEKLDPNNFTISELLISITTELLAYIHAHHDTMKLSENLEKKLINWSEKTVKEEISYNYAERHTGAGVDISAGLGKILNFFAKLSFDFQSGRKFTEISSIETERTLSDLILHCNLIVDEIKSLLHTVNKNNLIIIVDDLEKVNPVLTEKLFFNYSKQLTSIACNLIFTFPISLVFNPKYNIIINEFDERMILPMIKVHDKEWKDYENGIDNIMTLLYKRIDESRNLISKDILKEFIRMSGGSLRDLFRMLNLAAYNALVNNRKIIEMEDYNYSAMQLQNDYYNSISYNEETGITPQEYYDLLVKCHKDKEKKPMNDRGMLDLRYNMCVLGYNSQNWYDVHPAVRAILLEKKMI